MPEPTFDELVTEAMEKTEQAQSLSASAKQKLAQGDEEGAREDLIESMRLKTEALLLMNRALSMIQ